MPDKIREETRQLLQHDNVYIGTARTALTGAVVERKIRYITTITLFGDGVATRTVWIEKLEEDGTTYTKKYDGISVPPTGTEQIPKEGRDIENPILVLEGGARPYGRVSGNSLNATIEYWDNDI